MSRTGQIGKTLIRYVRDKFLLIDTSEPLLSLMSLVNLLF